MRVNHNISALNAWRNLFNTDNELSKSMERLSSGLRINRASDDAAGLAISEKMRGQIRGLNQAVRNAQDGISLIQTAEGSLNETHSILQRMRELTVQAANDTLTASDRVEIQKEINQLRTEIDRVANTTEFNTKKLLDGSTAALTSTDRLETRVFMRDGLRIEDQFGEKSAGGGNFLLEINATPGAAQIQKTDIFKLKHDVDLKVIEDRFLGDSVTDMSLNAANFLEGDYTVDTDAALAENLNAEVLTDVYSQQGEALLTSVSSEGIANAAANLSLSLEVTDVNTADDEITVAYSFYETAKDGTVTIDSGTRVLNTAANDNEVFGGVTFNTFTLEAAANFEVGDRMIVNSAANAATDDDGVTVNLNGGAVANFVFADEAINDGSQTFNFYQLDADTGEVLNSQIDLTFDTLVTETAAGFTVSAGGAIGDLASLNAELRDIDRFWDANGNFLLAEPQTITLVQGDGTKASFTLFENDTIKDLVDKIDGAIRNEKSNLAAGGIEAGKGLGQGQLVGEGVGEFAYFVEQADPNGELGTVEGTIVINSAVTGQNGEIQFVGDEDVLKALSLTNIRDSVENQFSVNVTDAHSGDSVAENIQVTGNLLVGTVHSNVDVEFDPMANIEVAWQGAAGNANDNSWVFASEAESYETFVHLADNTMVFHIGANPLQDVAAGIGDMRARALGVSNIQVTDRESANRALAKIDNAVERVSAERSKMGALQNRLDHTINNLMVASENLTAAESRIRDVDMAAEMMEFTKNQILMQAGTAMLAQANMRPQSVLQLLG